MPELVAPDGVRLHAEVEPFTCFVGGTKIRFR